MRRAIIVGATSGLGLEVAKILLGDGWRIGVAARRLGLLEQLRAACPDRVEVAEIDVTAPDAAERLDGLVDRVGGMDLYFHASGIGWQNPALDPAKELATVDTNALGFARMTGEAFRLMAGGGGGLLPEAAAAPEPGAAAGRGSEAAGPPAVGGPSRGPAAGLPFR